MPEKCFSLLYKICFAFALLLLAFSGIAQKPVISEERARRELEKMGFEEEEMREKLLEKGIDIDNIDPTDTAALLELETALQEAVAELEAEKAFKNRTSELRDSLIPGRNQNNRDNQELPDTEFESEEQPDDGGEVVSDKADKPETETEMALPETVIYGQHIFRNKGILLFNQSENIKPTNSYVLGVGDEITISIWGKSQENANYTINAQGYIKPSQMPRIYLKGMTLGKARDALRKRYAEYYRFRPEEFEVVVNYARTIMVNIVGEVFQYGSFTIPAVNTAFNALVASGGPTDIGSVRNIKLIRPGEQARKIDVYEYLMNPGVAQDFYLQDNDILHVEVAEKVVAVEGAVRRPFQYELIRGENLKKLLEYAGGLKDNAYKKNIQITRFSNDEEKIIDVNLKELFAAGRDFELFTGDRVFINEIPKSFENFAEISGAVEIPGRYEITDGMLISELISKGELKKDARTDIAFLLRMERDSTISYERIILDEILQNQGSPENLQLKAQDRLLVLSLANFTDQDSVVIGGAVRIPTKIPFGKNQKMRVSDALVLAGGLRQDATEFAYIFRTNPSNIKQKEYLRVDMAAAAANESSIDNPLLEPTDSIVVFSNLTYLDESFIKVSGAVRKPGSYKFDESLKLQDVLTMAGGIKLEATSSRIDIFRVVIENDQPTRTIVETISIDENLKATGENEFILKPYDQIIVREVPEFEFQRLVRIEGEVKYPGMYALVDKNEQLWSAINRAGGLTVEAFPEGATLYRSEGGIGFVVMGLDEVKKDKSSRFNYILKEGDVITIPKQKDLVTITGATKAKDIYPDNILKSGKINIAYQKGKNAKFYVDKYAAGVGDDGRRKYITVEHANGEIERTKSYVFFNVYPKVRPGSVITVGKKKIKPEKIERKKEKVDWGRTIADSIAQATAILSLILLIQQVNK